MEKMIKKCLKITSFLIEKPPIFDRKNAIFFDKKRYIFDTF